MTVNLDTVIEQVDSLPALPATAAKLLQVMSEPNVTVDKLIETVQYDQNLTSQVLKLCNSAYFGLSRKIDSLRAALSYLGSKQLTQLVMGAHCHTILEQSQPGYGLIEGMLWQHSSAVALAARLIGSHVRVVCQEALFTAGLLHDIGKIVLGNFLADRYQEVLDLVSSGTMTFHDAERTVLGYTHAETGEVLISRWQLPQTISAAARYHHEPASYVGDDDAIRQTVDLVHVADTLVMTMGVGLGHDGLLYTIDSSISKKYDLNEHVFDRIRVDVLTGLQDLKEIYEGARVSV